MFASERDSSTKCWNIEDFLNNWLGKTESENVSQVPIESIVTSMNRAICQASFSREIVPTQIFVGETGNDSCNDDSGGPLLYVDVFKGQQLFVQFGIISF